MEKHKEVICDNCNKLFSKRISQIKRSKNNFCCHECYYEFKRNNKIIPHNKKEKIKYNCDYCNKEFEMDEWYYNNIKSGKQKTAYCSKECKNKGLRKINSGVNNVKYSRVLKKCEQCEKEFYVKNYQKETRKYCSKECADKTKVKEKIKINCTYCKKEIYLPQHKIKEKNFCSRECSSKSQRHRYTKECVICNKKFEVHNYQKDEKITCSKKCANIWLKEIYCNDPKIKEKHRQNGINSITNQKKSGTKPEKMVEEFLKLHNINFIPQHPMYNMFVVDFYLPKIDTVIEVLGDYWHGHPDKYGDGENKKSLSERQIKNKKKDEIKKKYLTKAGHKLYMIWECDIYNDINKELNFLLN